MVVDKRGRYYAPMMLVVLYTMLLYLVVAVAVKRYQVAKAEEIRVKMATEGMRWQSPMWSLIDEIMHLGQVDRTCYISPYDALFIEASDIYNTDWRLMSAIAYCESRFRPYVVSHTGAVGLMQIMPRTGDIYGVDVDVLVDPKVSIVVANQHFNYIAHMLSMPREITNRDRSALVLASYNGGVGRVFDAMRLARMNGDDPHLWSVIRVYLSRLKLPDFYLLPEVRCGRFATASMTIRYVEDVLKRFEIYCEQTSSCTEHLLPVGDGVHRH